MSQGASFFQPVSSLLVPFPINLSSYPNSGFKYFHVGTHQIAKGQAAEKTELIQHV